MTILKPDQTVRWSTKGGDYILWMQWPFLQAQPVIKDFFYMRPGEFLTITTRFVDLPAGFTLHHSEVDGAEAYSTATTLAKPFQSIEPMDGPNLWRLSGGDRLVWVRPEHAHDPLLEILELDACALAYGSASGDFSLQQLMNFGGAPDETGAADITACRCALQTVKKMGIPSSVSEEWLFRI